MNRGSTIFLRLAVIGMGLFAVFMSTMVLWNIFDNWAKEFPSVDYLRYPIIAGLGLAPLTFLLALTYVWKLLMLIDTNKVFSSAAVKTLSKIKYCAFGVGAVMAAAMPLVYYIAEQDDAPGLIIVGAAVAGTPVAAGVFLAVAQRLLQTAISFKSENDLTV